MNGPHLNIEVTFKGFYMFRWMNVRSRLSLIDLQQHLWKVWPGDTEYPTAIWDYTKCNPCPNGCCRARLSKASLCPIILQSKSRSRLTITCSCLFASQTADEVFICSFHFFILRSASMALRRPLVPPSYDQTYSTLESKDLDLELKEMLLQVIGVDLQKEKGGRLARTWRPCPVTWKQCIWQDLDEKSFPESNPGPHFCINWQTNGKFFALLI